MSGHGHTNLFYSSFSYSKTKRIVLVFHKDPNCYANKVLTKEKETKVIFWRAERLKLSGNIAYAL